MTDLSDDWLLGRRVQLRQPAAGYRAAIDPVMLAASVNAAAGTTILDLGCGVGAASFCLLARCPDLNVVGYEVQPELAMIAAENALQNKASDRFTVQMADAFTAPYRMFQHVILNPPFHAAKDTASENVIRRVATHTASPEAWVRLAARYLKPRGILNLIYPAARLSALFAALAPDFGAIELAPLWPRADRPAKRVLLRAIKGSRAMLEFKPGLVLHGEGQSYSEAAENILRHAAPFRWENPSKITPQSIRNLH